MGEKEEFALELEGITKIFPGVKALDQVSFRVKKGEILALVGENGAGKSTLINILSGVFLPTEGQIKVNGRIVKITHPGKASALGIGVVHQERNLIDTFTVAENICFLDITKTLGGRIHQKEMNKKASEVMKRIQLEADPTENVLNLTSGKKQMLEIARALSIHSNILLLDEPTASISLTEAQSLLEIVQQLRNEGVSIIYISHKFEEIFKIADRITVIRDGQNVGETFKTSDVNRERLIELMIGRKQTVTGFALRDFTEQPVVLKAEGISSKLNPIPKSFQLKKGEILGWYGLVGAGRTELAREVIGIDPIQEGSLWLNGKRIHIGSYEQAFGTYKICYISENRKEEGLFLQHSIADNIAITALDKIVNKAGFISYKAQQQLAEKYRREISIKTQDVQVETASLSGGNQQKVCIAKGLCTQPEIMIIDEPTVGIDVNTKSEIHKLIFNLSEQGISIIVISSDLTELIGLADRIVVFKDNEIKGELTSDKDYEGMSTKIMTHILI